jgi:hypothetical protein
MGFEGDRRQILEVELVDDGKGLMFTEACDMYYKTTLTKSQVIELANDLLRLSEKMKD